MKIVILGTAYPFRGGLATFTERLARQFQDEGHEVEVITFTLQYPSFLFPGKTQYTTDPAPKDLHITRQLNSCNPFNWLRVGRMLRKQQPDLVICCYWMAFFAPMFGTICRLVHHSINNHASGASIAALAAHHSNCIALVHNMFGHEKSILDKLFAPYFVHSQDAFVTLSDAVAKEIKSLNSKLSTLNNSKLSTLNNSKLSTLNSKLQPQVAISPHPIYDHYGERMSKDEACAALHLNPNKKYLLFFGLVRAYKGLDLLLDALERIKDTQPDVQLLIAGEFYEDEDKYRQQIARNGLEDRVILRNEFIPDADLRKYFGAADLIVQPYKSATQSGVTQVAFHFEKPILVTNVGGLGEIVHHGKMGYAVAPDSQEIAECMEDYFAHNRQSAFTAYLQKEKVKYAWSKMTHTFLQLMNQLHD